MYISIEGNSCNTLFGMLPACAQKLISIVHLYITSTFAAVSEDSVTPKRMSVVMFYLVSE